MRIGFRSSVVVFLLAVLPVGIAFARTSTPSRTTAKKDGKVVDSARAKKHTARHRRHRYYEHFYTSSFADDIVTGDITTGEDPVVRQAAIDALGNMNGTIVAIDPTNGRILAMVNQKLALSEGAQPCSTIKLAVALAALNEQVVTPETLVSVGRRSSVDLTEALAKSNNAYFEALGRKLGFNKVSYYAHQFGLGELAAFNIEGEHLGVFPSQELDAKLGGVGKMCSFGESISMTPLQLGALVSAIANGGTLYYLQHPTTPEDLLNFQPRIKRQLNIGPLIPEISMGMMGAVDYGTARSVHLNFNEEQILGKTGTCSKDGTRFGWFASYANTQVGHIVTVVFLQGGRPTYGPKAAEISGKFYRGLYDHRFFAVPATATTRVNSEKSTAVGTQQ
ncbi:MAG TPA: penicillin-binding transpeptidase domain-containing protein [Candidatus Angelobacter sp.]|jgi:cell division protein FtsI/penicillin-binding protein 2|nr:penicillin-binding transpeptidase domain-containing protein [Candidatus Angelobacter sp.]